MTKQELLDKIAKAKANKNLTDKQRADVLALYEKKLSALGENYNENPEIAVLQDKIAKAKANKNLTDKQRADVLALYNKKLSAITGKKDVAEVQAENKEILKEVETVKKNETIPTEIKPKLVAKIKEEVNKVMLDEKKAVREVEKAKTKPKKAQAKQKLAEVKERKAEVKELVVKVSKKHESPQKFRDLLKRLTDTGKYDFLKSMSKDEILRDMKRVAKPMGWRFRGKGNYKNPNRTEIKAGVKSGAVYYETRPERSDVSKTVRLAKGGMIGTNKANEFSKGKYVWVREQGGITDMVLSQSAFEELFEEMKAIFKLEMDEPKFKVFSKNGRILQLKLKEIYS